MAKTKYFLLLIAAFTINNVIAQSKLDWLKTDTTQLQLELSETQSIYITKYKAENNIEGAGEDKKAVDGSLKYGCASDGACWGKSPDKTMRAYSNLNRLIEEFEKRNRMTQVTYSDSLSMQIRNQLHWILTEVPYLHNELYEKAIRYYSHLEKVERDPITKTQLQDIVLSLYEMEMQYLGGKEQLLATYANAKLIYYQERDSFSEQLRPLYKVFEEVVAYQQKENAAYASVFGKVYLAIKLFEKREKIMRSHGIRSQEFKEVSMYDPKWLVKELVPLSEVVNYKLTKVLDMKHRKNWLETRKVIDGVLHKFGE
ncbi:hypothetical protein V6R21_08665 [Limibacter armeniacum]|uniref:hypothetical protein n=1 Tax=Limibacter armeniacum TaxID=466084 RepID=UPI002FE68FB5